MQNTSSELNHTGDGFLNSILDEDLQLSDICVNDSSKFFFHSLHPFSSV